jgi:phosphoribosylformimino-5-aminoimidazole carboxamide ribotide isomerase
MRVIGVLDLARGVAVHARGGERARYAPVESCLTRRASDPVALATAYREVLGLDELYAADLDAIGGAAPQRPLARRLAECCGRLWLDAGISTEDRALGAVADGAARVVVGLETLASFDDLAAIARAVGGARTAFSLDLRAGMPIVRPAAAHPTRPVALVERAAAAGVEAVIVLDVARVGGAAGLDLALVERVRGAVPHVELVAGGGVRGRADLERLAGAGCDAALVATALHDGRLRTGDVAAFSK